MGNICPWCCKNSSESSNNQDDRLTNSSSQRSLDRSEPTERTRLLRESNNHRQNSHPVNNVIINSPTTTEPVSSVMTVDPLPPPNAVYENSTDHHTAKNETTMSTIVDRMLPDLIDVGGWGAATHQPNNNTSNYNAQNDQIRQILSKSLQSNRVSAFLPDAGVSNLSSLLSNRPISADICHFVSHTASELSRLLTDEIKIVHKEDLVVDFG